MLRHVGCWLLAAMAGLAAGCTAPSSNPPDGGLAKEEVVPLRFVVVDDPPLAEAIRREWKARSQAPLEVVEADWSKGLPENAPAGDAVVYPLARLGELAEKKWTAPLPDAALQALDQDRDDLSPFAMQAECNWGQVPWAIPFGSQDFVLFARTDLLRQNDLGVPATWAEYVMVVRRLKESDWAKEAEHIVAAEPLAEGWAGLLLLARSAAYLRHRGNYSTYFEISSMEPTLTSPPIVKGLEELAAANEGSRETAVHRTPDECLDLFWSGKAALAIALPRSPNSKRAATSIAPENVAVVELPGSADVYNPSDQTWEKRAEDDPQRIPLLAVSGRLGSLLAGSPNKIVAARALSLITGKEWSPAISPKSKATGPFRRSQIEKMDRWLEGGADPRLSRDLANRFAARFDTKLAISPPMLPGRERYLAALDAAVESTVSGKTMPAAALATAADAWRAITRELGMEAQKSAYRRSLGLKE